MGNLDDKIAVATRYVNRRRIVEEQRKRIAEGLAEAVALDLLKTFERSLEILEADLDRLLAERTSN